MKEALRQIRGLSNSNKWFLLKCSCLSFVLRISFKVAGFKKTIALLSNFNTDIPVHPNENNPNNIERYRRLIVLSHSFRPALNCLSISAAYWWLMKRKGITTELKFGMKTAEGKFAAHAWLEYKGKPLAEDGVNEKYTAFHGSIV
jgi:hypothetical protein